MHAYMNTNAHTCIYVCQSINHSLLLMPPHWIRVCFMVRFFHCDVGVFVLWTDVHALTGELSGIHWCVLMGFLIKGTQICCSWFRCSERNHSLKRCHREWNFYILFYSLCLSIPHNHTPMYGLRSRTLQRYLLRPLTTQGTGLGADGGGGVVSS